MNRYSNAAPSAAPAPSRLPLTALAARDARAELQNVADLIATCSDLDVRTAFEQLDAALLAVETRSAPRPVEDDDAGSDLSS